MARKSKSKYEMKGHSIPGIKGFKGSALEDGKAASSAFQMQSPLYEEEIENPYEDVEFVKKELGEHDQDEFLRWKEQGERTGVQYGMEELVKMFKRLKLNKQRKEEEKKSATEKMDDVVDKDHSKVDADSESDLDKDSESTETTTIPFDPLAKDKIKYGKTLKTTKKFDPLAKEKIKYGDVVDVASSREDLNKQITHNNKMIEAWEKKGKSRMADRFRKRNKELENQSKLDIKKKI